MFNLSTVIQDNHKFGDQTHRTPYELFIKGKGLVKYASTELAGFVYLPQKEYVKAIAYLEAAAILGQVKAPFFLSSAYTKIDQPEIATKWLLLSCELGDEYAIKHADKEQVSYRDGEAEAATKKYADYIKQSALTYKSSELVSLEQIEQAIKDWDSVNFREHSICLTANKMKLTSVSEEWSKMQENYTQSILRYHAASRVKDNYQIREKMPDDEYEIGLRTPHNLYVAGAGTANAIKDVMISDPKKFARYEYLYYSGALWYLKAAIVLGQENAAYRLSAIYHDSCRAIENQELAKLWLAIAVEVGDSNAKKEVEKRGVVIDDQARGLASKYAYFLEMSSQIYQEYEIIGLEQIEEATEKWNMVDVTSTLKLTPHTLELSIDNGGLGTVPGEPLLRTTLLKVNLGSE